MTSITGSYMFVSQENFENYLVALKVGKVRRGLIMNSKPIIVVVARSHFTITTKTSILTSSVTFSIGKAFDANFDLGDNYNCLATLGGTDTLVISNLGNPSCTDSWIFSDDGLIVTYQAEGITAIRTFKRL